MVEKMSTVVFFKASFKVFLVLLYGICVTSAIKPSNGDVRLVNTTGGRSLREGFLEIYFSANDTWGSVCVNRDSQNLGNTVCRQLGYIDAVNLSSNESSNEFPLRSPLLRGVTCDRTYLHILACNYLFINDAMEDICEEGNVIPFITCSETNVTSKNQYEGQVALFNGKWNSQGLLQVYINGQWGTVCLEFFTQSIADVVCRQLGYTSAKYYGQYSMFDIRLIWLRHMNCSNASTNCFKDCYSAPTIKNIYCSNKNDVFLMCTFDVSKQNSDSVTATRESCQIEYKNVPRSIVIILMILFCMIVLIYIFIFIARVGIAAYHKTDRYKVKESERRHHFKDVYHSSLDRNSLTIDHNITTSD